MLRKISLLIAFLTLTIACGSKDQSTPRQSPVKEAEETIEINLQDVTEKELKNHLDSLTLEVASKNPSEIYNIGKFRESCLSKDLSKREVYKKPKRKSGQMNRNNKSKPVRAWKYKFDKVIIERAYQHVVRRDCDGRQISSQVEQVSDPNIGYRIKNDFVGYVGDGDTRFRIFNRTNCSTGGRDPITAVFDPFFNLLVNPLGGDYERDGHVTLDMARTVFNQKVEHGINFMDYQFAKCDSNGNCTEVYDEGTIVLAVDYQINHREGTKEVTVCEKKTNI